MVVPRPEDFRVRMPCQKSHVNTFLLATCYVLRAAYGDIRHSAAARTRDDVDLFPNLAPIPNI